MAPWRKYFAALVASAWLSACASVHNTPVNEPAHGSVVDQLHLGFKEVADEDDMLIGLAFSGGGTRAAAFSFGVLSAFDDIPVPRAKDKLLDRLDFISGVSGGSVTAAYYGLKKRAALSDFRERFLLQNAEEGLQTTLSLATMGRALGGGINDQQGLTRWLDAHLFHGATYGQFRASNGYARTMEHTIILAPGASGRGVGRALMTAIEEHARKAGVHSMFAGVSGRNPDGIAFHAALGYVEVARLKEVGWKLGRWHDVAWFQRTLRDMPPEEP